MKNINQKPFRLLAIAPSSRGFGYAVLEGQKSLVAWGVKRVEKGDKNKQSLAKVKKLIVQFQPDNLVMQNASTKCSRRAPRIKALSRRVIALAASQNLKVKLFSDKQVKRTFFADDAVIIPQPVLGAQPG